MTFVKICGITNLPDALLSLANGADALGLNFYSESPRYIHPVAAAEIVQQLKCKIQVTGVFVNETLTNITRIAAQVGLNAIQLHGDEDAQFVGEVKKATGLFTIKAIALTWDTQIVDVISSPADAILLDKYAGPLRGGTGQVVDWSAASNIRGMVNKLYLAGGLNPANVRKAISVVQPFAVDACSGLERGKGKKDADKVRDFIANAKPND